MAEATISAVGDVDAGTIIDSTTTAANSLVAAGGPITAEDATAPEDSTDTDDCDTLASLATVAAHNSSSIISPVVSPATVSAVAELDGRIQSLPQELQDWIKDLTIASSMPSGPIKFDRSYRPPLGLQISHKTRENFATEYYKNGVVHCCGLPAEAGFEATHSDDVWQFHLLGVWLFRLNTTHRKLIKTLEVVDFDPDEANHISRWAADGFRSRREAREQRADGEHDNVYSCLRASDVYGRILVPNKADTRIQEGLLYGDFLISQSVLVYRGIFKGDNGTVSEQVYRHPTD
jgi:hypothetical protein